MGWFGVHNNFANAGMVSTCTWPHEWEVLDTHNSTVARYTCPLWMRACNISLSVLIGVPTLGIGGVACYFLLGNLFRSWCLKNGVGNLMHNRPHVHFVNNAPTHYVHTNVPTHVVHTNHHHHHHGHHTAAIAPTGYANVGVATRPQIPVVMPAPTVNTSGFANVGVATAPPSVQRPVNTVAPVAIDHNGFANVGSAKLPHVVATMPTYVPAVPTPIDHSGFAAVGAANKPQASVINVTGPVATSKPVPTPMYVPPAPTPIDHSGFAAVGSAHRPAPSISVTQSAPFAATAPTMVGKRDKGHKKANKQKNKENKQFKANNQQHYQAPVVSHSGFSTVGAAKPNKVKKDKPHKAPKAIHAPAPHVNNFGFASVGARPSHHGNIPSKPSHSHMAPRHGGFAVNSNGFAAVGGGR